MPTLTVGNVLTSIKIASGSAGTGTVKNSSAGNAERTYRNIDETYKTKQRDVGRLGRKKLSLRRGQRAYVTSMLMSGRFMIVFAVASTAIAATEGCKPKPVAAVTAAEGPSPCERWSAQFEQAFAHAIKPREDPKARPSDRVIGDPANYDPQYSEELEDCCFFARDLSAAAIRDAGIAVYEGGFMQCLDKESGIVVRRRRRP